VKTSWLILSHPGRSNATPLYDRDPHSHIVSGPTTIVWPYTGGIEYAYRAADWQVFFDTVAGAAAALSGLLFVALSVNLALVPQAAYRARAREALSGLLVLAVIVLIPGQGRLALGGELLGGGLLLEAFGVRLQSETISSLPDERRGPWTVRLVPLHLATLAIPVAGASLLLHRFGGLLWLVCSPS